MAKKHPEPRVLNPVPDGPLRNERELCRLIAEVLIRKQKRLAQEKVDQVNPEGAA